MSDKTYNGWTNYETWLVALWLDNDQATQEQAKEIVMEDTQYNFQKDDNLKAFVEEMVELDEASLRTDLINSALSEVNWTEITNNLQQE